MMTGGYMRYSFVMTIPENLRVSNILTSRGLFNSIAERCLSYDEKPLLLFQKLKETGHKPVFMLRHIVSHLLRTLGSG